MSLNPLKATAAGWLAIALGHTVSRKPPIHRTYYPSLTISAQRQRLANPPPIPPTPPSSLHLRDNRLVPGFSFLRHEWYFASFPVLSMDR